MIKSGIACPVLVASPCSFSVMIEVAHWIASGGPVTVTCRFRVPGTYSPFWEICTRVCVVCMISLMVWPARPTIAPII